VSSQSDHLPCPSGGARSRHVFKLEAIAFYRSALTQVTSKTDQQSRYQPERDLIVQLHEGLGDVLELNGEIEAARDQFDLAAGSCCRGGPNRALAFASASVASTWVLAPRLRTRRIEKFQQLSRARIERTKRTQNWWYEGRRFSLNGCICFTGSECPPAQRASRTFRSSWMEHGTTAQCARNLHDARTLLAKRTPLRSA